MIYFLSIKESSEEKKLTHVLKNLTLVFIFSSLSWAGGNYYDDFEAYVDEKHAYLSNTLEAWSCYVDDELSAWLCEDPDKHAYELSKEELKETFTGPVIKNRVHSVDAFFQNRKYLDDTEDAFLSLRLDSFVHTRDISSQPKSFRAKVGVQIPLSKTKKEFKFFIGGLNPDNKNELSATEQNEGDRPEVGVNYFLTEKFGIESKYSLGISGLDPFVRARFYKIFKPDGWQIEPSQILKYSLDDQFEEETNIYFDRHFSDLSLFRITMHRKTQDEFDGMAYAFSFQYYWSPANNIGIRLAQSFIGNTEYRDLTKPYTNLEELETFGGIYEYATSVSFRQNIWRKWFFYEVRPGVNFHRENDYKPSYSVRIFIDIHFGKSYSKL